MKGWHFTSGGTLRDGRPIPEAGEWLEHDGPLRPCASGLHASPRLLDALRYAPGSTLHRVELAGERIPHGDPTDKYVARRRRIVWTLGAEVMGPLLRDFARRCALDVVHLWEAPEVVATYLTTGAEAARDAAWAAARDAARDAAWAKPRDAAQAAAQAAARAARDAAWAAEPAWAAAAQAAAWAAAAQDAARDAALAAQNRRLTAMVTAARRRA